MASFVALRRMRFGDCDPAGIAYFPRYFDMLNGVVEEWWSAIGFPWQTLFKQRRIGIPTAHLDADFRAMSEFADNLRFTLTIEEIGSRSVTLNHNVHRDDMLLWQAKHVLVAASLDSHKSIPWPDDIRAALVAFQESPNAYIPAT